MSRLLESKKATNPISNPNIEILSPIEVPKKEGLSIFIKQDS